MMAKKVYEISLPEIDWKQIYRERAHKAVKTAGYILPDYEYDPGDPEAEREL